MEKEINITNMDETLRILAVQMRSEIGDKEANFSKIENILENNIQKYPDGVDVVVLPEVWTVGWKPSVFVNSAEEIENSKTIEFLSKIAKRYNTNIIGGSFITKEPTLQPSKLPTLHNTCPVINKHGDLVASYDKMHLFSYYGCDEGAFIENGLSPVLVDYCFKSGEIASVGVLGENQQFSSCNDVIRIGLTICYDIRFPEIYRAYRKAGADVLINMAAWPKSRAVHWEALSKARAIENQCFVVALTQSGLIEENEHGGEYNLGHSRIINYNGEVISEIKNDFGDEEGVMFASLEFEEMYEFREKCTVLLDIHDKYVVE